MEGGCPCFTNATRMHRTNAQPGNYALYFNRFYNDPSFVKYMKGYVQHFVKYTQHDLDVDHVVIIYHVCESHIFSNLLITFFQFNIVLSTMFRVQLLFYIAHFFFLKY